VLSADTMRPGCREEAFSAIEMRSESNFNVILVQTRNPPRTRKTGGPTMTKVPMLAVPALVLMMLVADAMAQRRGSGAASGGVPGGMVGGLVGGSEGAQMGAKLGVVTGTGKGKKSGVDVVFTAGVLDAGAWQLAGASFVLDARIEDHQKETVRQICQTIRVADQFTEKKWVSLKRPGAGRAERRPA
jgi:hypothetical protein